MSLTLRRRVSSLLAVIAPITMVATAIAACTEGTPVVGRSPDAAPEDGGEGGRAVALRLDVTGDRVVGGRIIVHAEVSGAAPPGPLTWRFSSVPSGSTAMLTRTSSADSPEHASFIADAPGPFAVEASANVAGSVVTQTVSFDVRVPSIAYLREEGPTSFSIDRLSIDGDGGTTIGCPVSIPIDAGTFRLTPSVAELASDWWESPRGDEARFAFVVPTEADGGVGSAQLRVLGSGARCPETAIALDQTAFVKNNAPPGSPRFSPAGDRIAYLRSDTNDEVGVWLATIGFDGHNRHARVAVLPFAARVGRPHWLDNGRVAWLRITPSPGVRSWEIAAAEDFDGAPVTAFMRCRGTTLPSTFEVLPDGRVIDVIDGVMTISRRSPTSSECTERTKLSADLTIVADDVALSPEGDRVAFLATDASGAVALYRVSTDGQTPPVRLATAGSDAGAAGPRWLAGGGWLTWAEAAPQSPTAQVIRVLDARRDETRTVATSDADGGKQVFAIGTGSLAPRMFCTAARGPGSERTSWPLVFTLGLMAVIGLRRRGGSPQPNRSSLPVVRCRRGTGSVFLSGDDQGRRQPGTPRRPCRR